MASPGRAGGGSHDAFSRVLVVVGALAAGAVPCLLLSGCALLGVHKSPLIHCSPGYIPHDGHLYNGGTLVRDRVESMEECTKTCHMEVDCLSIEYSPTEKICIWNKLGGRPEAPKLRDYQFCERPQPANLKRLLFDPKEYVEHPEEKGMILANGNIRLFVVGSSNVLWMTWVDQLHLYLLRLGYKVPSIPTKTNTTYYPSEPQTCDDTQYFTALKTSRLGKIGWHSWDFAYNNWSDCEEDSDEEGKHGYRFVADHKVKCEHGPGCNYGREIISASSIAEDAKKSHITLVTTWFNDDQPDALKCFYGLDIPKEDIANMSITGLLQTTKSIHRKNPDVWVLILAKYSSFHCWNKPWMEKLSKLVKAAVEKEHRTLFIEYDKPRQQWRCGDLWQQQEAHANHPNCRGSKLMAHAILQRLFKEKILQRSIKLVDQGENLNAENCGDLAGAQCHTSMLCWSDPKDRKCKSYGGGSKRTYKHEELLRRNWEDITH